MADIGSAISQDLARMNSNIEAGNKQRAVQRNAATKMLFNSCGLSFSLYIKTALPAALKLAIFLSCFGITDIIRWVFRPTQSPPGARNPFRRKRRKGRGPKRLGRSRGRNTPLLERIRNDPNGVLGDLKSRNVSQGVHNLWQVDGLIQRGLWWWLVYEGLNDFFYNWSVGLAKSEAGQTCIMNGGVMGRNDGDVLGPIGSWRCMDCETIDQYGQVGLNGCVVGIGFGQYTVTGSGSVGEYVLNGTGYRTRVRQSLPFSKVLDESAPAQENENRRNDAISAGSVRGPAIVICEHTTDTGGAIDIQTMINAFAESSPVPDPTNVNCLGFEL